MSERSIEKNPSLAGDDVLREVWRVKDELSAARGHDIHKLFAQLRRAEMNSNSSVFRTNEDSEKPK
jgi:hypothetical protein